MPKVRKEIGDADKAVEAFINETLEYNPDGLIIFLSLLVESDV